MHQIVELVDVQSTSNDEQNEAGDGEEEILWRSTFGELSFQISMLHCDKNDTKVSIMSLR